MHRTSASLDLSLGGAPAKESAAQARSSEGDREVAFVVFGGRSPSRCERKEDFRRAMLSPNVGRIEFEMGATSPLSICEKRLLETSVALARNCLLRRG